MSRLGTILMAVALVSALLAVPLGVSAVAADEPNASVTPGERLAGVVGIQQAAVAGDLSDRRYEARLNRAETDTERAELVAERREEIERRLADHEAELADLRAARAAGNITEGTYRARVATLAAEKGSTERAAEQASETARRLPAEVRDARGISVDRLRQLRTNASELGGPETGAIAREIGGPNASNPAVGPRHGSPGASAPGRNSKAIDDPQPGGPEARSADSTSRPTGSSGADSAPRAEEPRNRQGDPDTSSRQDSQTGPAEPTDGQENAPTDAGQRSNGR